MLRVVNKTPEKIYDKLVFSTHPPYRHLCQMQTHSLRQEYLETEHLMQLLFQNCLTCAECQKEPCCAMAPACLRKIEIVQCLTLWMISQLLTCPICSSQFILICLSLCVCSGTNKTVASLQDLLPWSAARFVSNSASSKRKTPKIKITVQLCCLSLPLKYAQAAIWLQSQHLQYVTYRIINVKIINQMATEYNKVHECHISAPIN